MGYVQVRTFSKRENLSYWGISPRLPGRSTRHLTTVLQSAIWVANTIKPRLKLLEVLINVIRAVKFIKSFRLKWCGRVERTQNQRRP